MQEDGAVDHKVNYDLQLSDNNSHQSWDEECSENVVDLEDEDYSESVDSEKKDKPEEPINGVEYIYNINGEVVQVIEPPPPEPKPPKVT